MEMSAGFVVVLALLVFAVVTIAKGVRIVPQGEEWIVERLGKYHHAQARPEHRHVPTWTRWPTSW
jgi:regulator of protease activity HflC (stomatin/prohibitin superfamily)